MSWQLGALAAYTVALVLLGLFIRRKARSVGSFFVAGRQLGPVLIFATILAANIGAGSTVGAASLGYRDGIAAWWWVDPVWPSEAASALDRPHRISTNRGFDTGTYAYDGAGQIKRIGTQDFRYDRFKHLISGEVTVGTQDRVQSAVFDIYNNLLQLTTNGSVLPTSTSASTNRLTSFSALYDAAGNLTQQIRGGETHKYTWDPLGVMKYLQSTTDQAQVFLYDADDERLATYDCFPGICDSPGWELRTTVRGLGGEPLREYVTRGTDGWHWVRDYVYRGGSLLAAVEADEESGENVFHFHPDHLGTPRQITNASGVQVALHSYYPFGQEATDPAQTSFTKKFTGHERDTNGTGTVGDLDYMHARYCSPTLARFLSFDPIGGNPRNPQSWNRYAYALNNPINYTDPAGLLAELFFDLNFVFFDQITVFGSSPLTFEIPSWVLTNWFIDARSHFDNSRFNFSQTAFPAWEGWNGTGCDFWCQVFTEVGQNSQAASYLEFGVSSAVMGSVLGPLFSRVEHAAPTGLLRPIARSLGAAGDDILLKKAVNSNLPHAVARGVERQVFANSDAARSALRALTDQITKSGFPPGTLVDAARAGRFLVPVGENGLAVYQLGRNGTAKLKTVLIAR